MNNDDLIPLSPAELRNLIFQLRLEVNALKIDHFSLIETVKREQSRCFNLDLHEEIAMLKSGYPFPNIGMNPLEDKTPFTDPSKEFRDSTDRLNSACAIQQLGVPDQTALVWRIDISRILAECIWRSKHLPALELREERIAELEFVLSATLTLLRNMKQTASARATSLNKEERRDAMVCIRNASALINAFEKLKIKEKNYE